MQSGMGGKRGTGLVLGKGDQQLWGSLLPTRLWNRAIEEAKCDNIRTNRLPLTQFQSLFSTFFSFAITLPLVPPTCLMRFEKERI